ncbi:uncharacterized protein A1O9_07448 [Exophiala aquamarina CBS 119918]|uniref:Amidase domain-containing protein n=1 Tax=Exophiala aquamarina CBS 119918 TaxID=1182545 RepID=A0A072P9C7_9EURO|nr:uncharacterized protein A1O9_07448 [Exophiala aquamarina CBS 119918]KEF55868.1 hypothetical protein A1O9_07448 [Exophiala aquamarina CBS 119918]
MVNYIHFQSGGCLKLSIVLSWIQPFTTSGPLVSKGFSLQLNSIDYFASPYPSGNISENPQDLVQYQSVHPLYPVAVLHDRVGVTGVSCLVAEWKAKDDVFQDAFANIVFVLALSMRESLSVDGQSVLALPIDPFTVAPGPYFLDATGGCLCPAYSLYDDFAGAFAASLLQAPGGTFQTLSSQIAASSTLTIGVLSRLYYTPTKEQTVAGVRIAIKDLADLAGVKTSC